MPDEEIQRQRYEAIFRAVARRNLVPLAVCLVATVLVCAAFVLFVIPAVVPLLPRALNPYVAFLATIAIFLVGVTVLPTVAQLVLSPRSWLRAVEAINAVALNERARWVRATGRGFPRLFSRGHAAGWIRRNPGAGGLGRIKLLAWTGELNAAAEIAAALPRSTPKERFDRALAQAMVEFVATGRADLGTARAELAGLAAGPERDEARLDLAFEEARAALAAGDDWVAPLAAARDEVAVIPRGASIRDRIAGSLPSTIGLILVVATISFLIQR